MSKANEKRRDGGLLSEWFMDGTICAKTAPDGRPIKIIDLEDLEILWLAKKYFGRGDGLCLFGTATYLFSLPSLPAKRFNCFLLCY